MYTRILKLRERQYTIQHTWTVQYRLKHTYFSLLILFINKTNSRSNIHNKHHNYSYAVAGLVEALRYKLEGRGLYTRWGH